MMISLRSDQLHVHANAPGAALDASFQHIADVQVPTEFPYVDRPALKGESCVARNNERAPDAGKIVRQALGYAVTEIFLLGSPPRFVKGSTTIERCGRRDATGRDGSAGLGEAG